MFAQSYRAAVRAEHRGLVHRDQIVELAVQLGEFAIVISAGRRRGDIGEQLVAALSDIGGEFGLADFSEVVILDVVPLQKIVPRARQNVFALAVVLRHLQRVERGVHVLRGLDADVVAIERRADCAAKRVDSRQRVESQQNDQRQHQQRAVADSALQRRCVHRESSRSSVATISTSRSVASATSRATTSPLSNRRHRG